MKPMLFKALKTWLQAEARAQQLDQVLAGAVRRLDLIGAEQAALKLHAQRLFAGEMKLTMLDLLAFHAQLIDRRP